MLITLLLAAALTWSPPPSTHCDTYEEKTMARWQSICDDGTRAVHRWNAVLGRWESTVTPPARPAWNVRRR